MASLFKFDKQILDSPEIAPQLYENHLEFFIQLINDRYAAQTQAIEDRTQLIVDNLMTTKEFLLDNFPKDLLEMPTERFFEEHEGSLEKALKEIVKKLPISQKTALNNKNYDNGRNKVPLINKTENLKENTQSPIKIEEDAGISAKNIKTPIFSKKKINDFTGESSKNTDKSGKRPWVP